MVLCHAIEHPPAETIKIQENFAERLGVLFLN
jgi:hypothetical protein